MSDYYQFRDEKGTPIDYYQLVNDNNELCKEIERLNNIIDKQDKDITTLTKCKIKLKHIINELEKYVIEEIESYDKALNNTTFVLTEKGKESYEAEKMCFTDMLDKIKKLKESE